MANELYRHPLFQTRVELLSPDERVSISYQRAKLLMQTYRLTSSDVQFCSSRFWSMMMDPICSLDIAMFTILAAHVGLTIGTLSRHLKKRPDFKPLVDRLLRFDTVGIYLLTERGHGLDAFNIETTATKTADGYILHTPREEAAKFMPASTPSFGIPKVALVMARLIVDGQDRGSRFFVTPICNEREMYRGVRSVRLPPRSGTGPLDFAITTFDHVHLPPTALVASDILDYATPSQPLEAWWDEIWRIQLGTMAVPAPWISAIKAIAFIGGRYSMHRCLLGKRSEPVPILSFRTQQWPVVHATAVAMVMANWYPLVIRQAMKRTTDHRVRHAMSVIAKTTVCRHFQRCAPEVAERCGAQGTFEHNYFARIENDGKGVIIAEGDVLTLCIRLFSELLQRRYEVPMPDPGESLLALHASSLLEENRALLKSIGGDYRSDSFNALILPQSQTVIEAMGHALAYSAALASNLPKPILDVYECAVIRQDPACLIHAAEPGPLPNRARHREIRYRSDRVRCGLERLSGGVTRPHWHRDSGGRISPSDAIDPTDFRVVDYQPHAAHHPPDDTTVIPSRDLHCFRIYQ
ncbi:putative acyl-CoA dehydrogenase NM domain-like protein [Lyophyllum shimeji]|uniref:Acyl-CoA dehydrogenase NM domain-like protein n=1 Tax=Lyophyllum shimeji TaxID=47721 RepID=A0A9P3PSN9_LYOSH|nr:putative acyl-CoA dehydrogenase NM domain-like protein [Lyophyllum shimeji]